MSGVFIGAAVIGAAATVYSGVQQSSAAKDQAAAQREANNANQRAASASAARERIQAVRQARMAMGKISNTGGGMGMGQESSGIAGSIASIGSQTGSNIANINVQEGFAEMASQANQRAADAQSEIMKWQAIGNIGQTIFSQSVSRIGAPGAPKT